jgi:hypothetical protein
MISSVVRPLLNDIFYLGSRSPILASKKVASLVQQYAISDKQKKIAILEHIAREHHVDEHHVTTQVNV